MSINVHNITKFFGKQKVLDNVNFEINKGEIVGLLGPNGAGKTTLMRIITGFIPANQGEVFVNNNNVLEKTLEVKKELGYLPEQNPLYYNMYVIEYLMFVASIYKLNNKIQRIEEVINMTGLIPEINKTIGSLSKGYKQRVGLAQAIIHDPSVLILDEPTSGLDPNQIVEIRSLIQNLGKNKTVMLSTHIMQEVEAICDRVIIINNGKIVADNETANYQQFGNTKVCSLLLELQKPIDINIFKSIKAITKITKISDYKLVIEYNTNIDIRQDVFNLIVKNENVVLNMQIKEKSLEEAFSELTTN